MIIKNSNTRRSLFENRYAIFVIIFAIILFLVLVRIANTSIKKNMQEEANSIQNNTTIQTETTKSSNSSVLTGQTVSESVQTSSTEIIENFINYCNNQNIEEAYNLLTDDCKKQIFQNSVQSFKEKYVDKIFTSKKMVSIQNWLNSYGYTYRVKILDDMLSTGKISSTQDTVEDYYTIVSQDGTYKLNINGYIGKKTINKNVQINGITITVISKDMYKEYEEYNVKIENTTSKTILLDSQETTNSIYLIGSNDVKYNAYLYEIDRTTLTVESNETKNITIRFNKIYSNQTSIEKMEFTDIITDYETYVFTKNANRQKASIDL